MQNARNGWGVDSKLEERPGVPREHSPPTPLPSAPWLALEQQVAGPIAVRSPLKPMTPVFGTTVPPRLLSGVLRRAAYRMPDYKARRWMTLMLADRIDVIEHSLLPVALVLGGVAAILGGAFAIKRWREA